MWSFKECLSFWAKNCSRCARELRFRHELDFFEDKGGLESSSDAIVQTNEMMQLTQERNNRNGMEDRGSLAI